MKLSGPGSLFLSLVAASALLSAGCSDSSSGPGGGSNDPPFDTVVWYVDDDATGSGDGKSWENAFNHPSEAMTAASAGEQIWVAEGTYYGPGDEYDPVVAFKDSVSLYGGFSGDETDVSQRDWTERATFDGGDSLIHVVTGAQHALLYGIIVKNGSAYETSPSSAPERSGGGIYCPGGGMSIIRCSVAFNEAYMGGVIYARGDTMVIDSCMISDNYAYYSGADGAGGGGINISWGIAVITNCSILDNSSNCGGAGLLLYNTAALVGGSDICNNYTGDPGGYGGGAYISNPDIPELETEFRDCTFCFNTVTGGGGGAYVTSSDSRFTGCRFHSNEAPSGGSALLGLNSEYLMEHCTVRDNGRTAVLSQNGAASAVPRIFNCLFYGNGNSDQPGGAIMNIQTDTEISFCTIAGNAARNGAAIHSRTGASPAVSNCIIWGNVSHEGPPQIYDDGEAVTTVTWTDIDQDGYDAGNLFNMRSDPLFAWVGMNGVYYLSHIAAGEDSDSPCIDGGSSPASGFGLDSRTTRTDFVTDTGTADLGFHHEP